MQRFTLESRDRCYIFRSWDNLHAADHDLEYYIDISLNVCEAPSHLFGILSKRSYDN